MGWADLLQKEEASVTVPWTGGRRLVAGDRSFQVEGDLPREHGWHAFLVKGGRTATWSGAATAPDPVQAVVERVYADVPREVWPAAAQSVAAQLDYLRKVSGRGA